jgi:hypothetical protein
VESECAALVHLNAEPCDLLSAAPEHIESVIEDRSRWLFVKTLEELETGNPVFIDGNTFAI